MKSSKNYSKINSKSMPAKLKSSFPKSSHYKNIAKTLKKFPIIYCQHLIIPKKIRHLHIDSSDLSDIKTRNSSYSLMCIYCAIKLISSKKKNILTGS